MRKWKNSQELLPTILEDVVQSPKKSIINMNNGVTQDNANPTPDVVAQDAPSSNKPMNYNAPPFTPPQNNVRSTQYKINNSHCHLATISYAPALQRRLELANYMIQTESV